MTISYRFLLATVQEVTARMFTMTPRSQPVYSKSQLSELPPLESPAGSMKRTQTMQVTETPPLADGFPASQVHPHIEDDATIPSFFFYADAKWKARTNVTPGRQPDQGTRPRGVSEPNVWLYSLSWITIQELGA